VVLIDAWPMLSRTCRKSTALLAIWEPAVWRSQCADAISRRTAVALYSAPRCRNRDAALENTCLTTAWTAPRVIGTGRPPIGKSGGAVSPAKGAVAVPPKDVAKNVAKNLGGSIRTLYRWVPGSAHV
jgi:hypothetical protein